MKDKSIIIILLLILSVGKNLPLQSQQPLPTITPCLTDHHASPCNAAWVGPLFKTINTNNLNYTSFSCPTPPSPAGGCSFIVEYYTRIIDCPINDPPVHAFDIQVVAVKPSDQCAECYNANSDQIITELTYTLYEENAMFFQSKWGATGDNCPHQNEVVTKGKCYHWVGSQNLPCPNSEYVCCANMMGICYNSTGHVVQGSLTDWGRGLLYYNDANQDPRQCFATPINCSDGIPRCKTNMIIYDQLFCTGITCESGEWKDGISEPMYILGCGSSCQIRVHYLFKENADCNPPWKDYKITSIEKIGNCSGCPDAMLLSQAVNWVLQSGKLTPNDLQMNECMTNFRLINSKCWEVVNGVVQECQSPEWHCCTSIYQICWKGARDPVTNNKIYEVTLLNQSSDWALSCTSPCFIFCGLYPVRIAAWDESQEKSKNGIESKNFISYAVPNPTTGNTDIHFKGDYKGLVSLKISD